MIYPQMTQINADYFLICEALKFKSRIHMLIDRTLKQNMFYLR